MKKKQFKAESRKLLDMMINSIYTHKEIFLRELFSNASDAIDKLYYRQLEENIPGLSRDDYYIKVNADKEARTIVIEDNGVGMTREELENNLGTIAKSGSLDFKQNNEAKEDIDIIGQFGVGFYSAFMVSDKVEVKTKAYGNWQGLASKMPELREAKRITGGMAAILKLPTPQKLPSLRRSTSLIKSSF